MPGKLRDFGLLARFSVLSLVLIALIGLGLAHVLKKQIQDRALDDAEQSAQRIVRLGIQPQLSQAQLRRGRLTGRQFDVLDGLLREEIRSHELVGLRIWNRDRRVVYAEDHELVGRRFGDNESLRVALNGHSFSHLEDEAAKEGEEAEEASAPGGLLEVYVPVLAGGERPAGAFEIYLPYAPVAAAITEDTRELYLALFGGLALLYVALFRIVFSASRRLRRQAAENRHLALHDALTGLPNRTLFHDRIEQAVKIARRQQSLFAVAILDLNRFKEVNDTLGHRKGDLLLGEVGVRLRDVLRDSDTIARLGGDEFGLLLPAIDSSAAAVGVTEKLGKSLEREFAIDELIVSVDASIGIALYPEHGEDVDTLLQRADVAMYEAKRTHGRQEVYTTKSDPYDAKRLALVGELRQAIENDELMLHYQPKVDLSGGRTIGVEALARWQHPDRGPIPPDEFIPMAEHTGLIRPLTRRVLNVALDQCRIWQDAGRELTVSVNLSPRNLLDSSIPEEVSRLLAKWQVEPRLLELEITESSIMVDPARATDVLDRLHQLGVGLAIDDFGTGYSSLAYLRRLPVSQLKIDRGFVTDMCRHESDAFIVRSTISLGQNLGFQVVAEGVEDEETLRQLATLGCDAAQGYHLSRPMPPGELAVWLAERDRAQPVSRAV